MKEVNNSPRGHMGATIKFSSNKDKDLFLQDLKSQSQIIDIFNSWKVHGSYNIKEINFKKAIISELTQKKFINQELFENYGGRLEKLHLCLNEDMKNLDESEQNKISISFYETSSKLKDLYIKFVKNIVSKKFSEKVYFQAIPTFRFHFPNQKGYNWNDRYHTDIMLGHPPYEINIWLPFTSTYKSNSMRITSYEDSLSVIRSCGYDFEKFAERVQYDDEFCKILRRNSISLEMDYGDFIMFDPRCLHCTQNNITDDTRISMDIRIITEKNLEKYSRDYRTTGRKKMPFTPGNYFSKESV